MSLQQQYKQQYNASQHPNQSDDEYDPEMDPMFAPLPPQIREKTEDEREELKTRVVLQKTKKTKNTFKLLPLNTCSIKREKLCQGPETQLEMLNRIYNIEDRKRKEKKIMMALLKRQALEKIENEKYAKAVQTFFSRKNKMFTPYNNEKKGSWSKKYTWKNSNHLVVDGVKLPKFSRSGLIKKFSAPLLKWLAKARKSLNEKFTKSMASSVLGERKKGLHFAHRRNGGGKKGRRNNKGTSAWSGFNPATEKRIAEQKRLQKAQAKKAKKAKKVATSPAPRRAVVLEQMVVSYSPKKKAVQVDNFADEEEEEVYDVAPPCEEQVTEEKEFVDSSGLTINIIGKAVVNVNIVGNKITDVKVEKKEKSKWEKVEKKSSLPSIELGFKGNENLEKLRSRNNRHKHLHCKKSHGMGHKNIPCKSVQSGTKCRYGKNCRFAHTLSELTITRTCVYGNSCKFKNSQEKCCYFQHPDESATECANRVWEWTVGKLPKPINLTKVLTKKKPVVVVKKKTYVAPTAPWKNQQKAPKTPEKKPTPVDPKFAPKKQPLDPQKLQKADKSMRRIAYYSRKISHKCNQKGCLGNGLSLKGICSCTKNVSKTGKQFGDERYPFPLRSRKCRCDRGCIKCRGSGFESAFSAISTGVSRKFGSVEMGQCAEQLVREITYTTAKDPFYSNTQIDKNAKPLLKPESAEKVITEEVLGLLKTPDQWLYDTVDHWENENPSFYFKNSREMGCKDPSVKTNTFRSRYSKKEMTKREYIEKRMSCAKDLLAEQEVICALNKEGSGFTCPGCGKTGTLAHCGGSGSGTFASFQDAFCVECAKTSIPVFVEIKTRNEKKAQESSTYGGSFIGLQVLKRKRAKIVLCVLSRDTGNLRCGLVDSCQPRITDDFCYSVQQFVENQDFQISDACAPASYFSCSRGLHLMRTKVDISHLTNETCEKITSKVLQKIDFSMKWSQKKTTNWNGYCKK